MTAPSLLLEVDHLQVYFPVKSGVLLSRTGPDFVGMIIPLPTESGGPKPSWFISLQYDPAGYIKDDDAQHWDAGKLLQTLKEGTEAANADRERLGIPPISVSRVRDHR